MTDEVRKSMAETQAELDRAMEDPSFRAEVAAAQAQYAAMDLVESILLSAKSKINEFKKTYHKGFKVSVSIDDNLSRFPDLSPRELAFA
ncbi:MAG: hypothetical protein IJ173_05720 [Kiritimatiellae bacterium]|nr:hypothetical protein [Kiritimatiellia bacterium]